MVEVRGACAWPRDPLPRCWFHNRLTGIIDTMNSSSRVAVVGTLNLDQVVHVERLPADGETVLGLSQTERPGGKGANQAAAAAAITSTSLIAAVGDDAAGTTMLEYQRAQGVDVEHVRRVTGLSGRAVIEVDADGTNRIIVLSGANAELTADRVTASLDALDPEVVLTQLESPREVTDAAARWCRAHLRRFVLNPSPVAALDDSILALADPLVVNEIEAAYYGTADDLELLAQRLRSRCTSAVITLGAEGVLVVDDGRVTRINVRGVTAVDTTGAGDVFAGTLVAHLAAGIELPEAASLAADTATDFVSRSRN